MWGTSSCFPAREATEAVPFSFPPHLGALCPSPVPQSSALLLLGLNHAVMEVSPFTNSPTGNGDKTQPSSPEELLLLRPSNPQLPLQDPSKKGYSMIQ